MEVVRESFFSFMSYIYTFLNRILLITYFFLISGCRRDTSILIPDVYIAGSEIGSAGLWNAKIWKNGIATALTNSTYLADANSVYVSGTDVYVAGFEYNDSVSVAKVIDHVDYSVVSN